MNMNTEQALAADLERARHQAVFLMTHCPNPDCPIGCPDEHADLGYPEVNCGTFRDALRINVYDANAADELAALATVDDATLAREIRAVLPDLGAILRRFHSVDAVAFQELEMLAEAERQDAP